MLKKLASRFKPFEAWINTVFNHYDHSRVAKVGRDRAAAEWVLRNEGMIRECNGSSKNWMTVKNYNSFVSSSRTDFKLGAISAANCNVSSVGCRHLSGLKYVHYIQFKDCILIDNYAVKIICENCWHSLEHLDLSGTSVNSECLKNVIKLEKLETLTISSKLKSQDSFNKNFNALTETNTSLAIEFIE